jgi:hypothetical protein
MGAQLPAKAFYATVTCVTQHNPDGTDRQKLIKDCRIGDRLRLVRDPDHPSDSNAVKVCLLSEEQIGCLRTEVTAEVGPTIDAGGKLEAEIIRLSSGGRLSKRPRGVKILIRWLPDDDQDS